MTDRVLEREPPPLDLLAQMARNAGYENPLVEIGDMPDPTNTDRRVPCVRVILWGSGERRQVAGLCEVRPGMSEDEAIRSALAKALELASDPGARA